MSGTSSQPRRTTGLERIALAAVLLLVATALVLGFSSWRRSTRERWARADTLPAIQRLLDAEDFPGAFRLAEKVRPLLADDPAFDRLWLDLTQLRLPLQTDPPGAQASWRLCGEPETAAWRPLGTTPITAAELPPACLRLRLEKPGFEPVEAALAAFNEAGQRPVRLLARDPAR